MKNDNIYLVLKIFESSLISTSGESDKPKTIGYSNFLEIISHLEKREFIEETDEMNLYKITKVGLNKLKELDEIKAQKEKDEKAERYKLHNESVTSGWKRKTFWFIFIFGLFGGVYSAIDLINKMIPKSGKEQKQLDTKENIELLKKSEIDSLKTD